ncbi:Putative nuclease HARBI1 [Trachymyrmex cornetzi]|uniref:Putative nuclease HARBI1 n=1 Tax=Trachymyrmex cornetzi TaxID=471704 RepID=A0A151JP65_9HYME|nr:Putative nuclease HARBI1 [Trachymyrmex cornetzi]
MDRKKIFVLICVNKFLKSLLYLNDDEDDLTACSVSTKNESSNKKIKGYVERIILSFNNQHFKSHFRILPSTFEYILNQIGEKLHGAGNGIELVTPEKQFLIALWHFATPDSYRSIQRFNVSKGTAITAVRRVAKALCEISQRYIIWPNENDIENIVYGFSRARGFPAVCDDRMRFTHIYVGNVGSVHDSRVFQLSAVQQYINDLTKFPNDTHIIGDAAYGLHQHLLDPYPDNGHLTQRQKNYNFCFSSIRMLIERAYAYLKWQWRSLLHVLAVNDLKFASYHIFTCCVLHNICLLQKDELDLQERFMFIRGQAEV